MLAVNLVILILGTEGVQVIERVGCASMVKSTLFKRNLDSGVVGGGAGAIDLWWLVVWSDTSLHGFGSSAIQCSCRSGVVRVVVDHEPKRYSTQMVRY